MLRLLTLGVLDLRRPDGREIGSVLAQPKRFALLAYLAVARPGGFQRRDSVMALFWPESDQTHARDALRQAVRHLRQSLGSGTPSRRGDEELGIDEALLWCDVVAFERAVEAKRLEEALELYQGDLLPGFFLSDLPAFDAWLEGRRRELRARALDVAWSLAAERERAADATGAARYAKRALRLTPDDEDTVRRLMALLDRVGDRASAVRAYGEFADRLGREYDVEPSEETRALAAEIRSGGAGVAPATDQGRRPGETRGSAASPGNADEKDAVGRAVAVGGRSDLVPPVGWRGGRAGMLRHAAVVATLLLVGVMSARWVLGWWRHPGLIDPVWVFPLENRSGDATLDALGWLASDWIRDGLSRVRDIQVLDGSVGLPGSHAVAPSAGVVHDLSHDIGGALFISGALYRLGDSIQLRVQVADAQGRSVMPAIGSVAGQVPELPHLLADLADRVTGALAANGDPSVRALDPAGSHPPSWGAYLAWADGLRRYSRHDYAGSRQSMLHAASLDSTGAFVTPLIWAAAASGNLGENARADSLLRIVDGRPEGLRPFDRGLLDLWIEGLRGNWLAAHRAATKMLDLAPQSELALYLAGSSAFEVGDFREAVEDLSKIDVEHSAVDWDEYDTRLTWAYHLLGDYKAELVVAAGVRERRPEVLRVEVDEIRPLVGLGRIEEALARLDYVLSLPPQAQITPGDVALATADELRAHGHPDAADAALHRALAWYRSRSPAERGTAEGRFGLATILYRAGRWQEARDQFEQLWDEDADCISCLGYVGGAAAHMGEVSEAALVADSLGRIERPYLRGENTLWRARVMAVLGREDEAMRYLQAARGEGMRFGLSLHTDPDLSRLRDDPAFRGLMDRTR